MNDYEGDVKKINVEKKSRREKIIFKILFFVFF